VPEFEFPAKPATSQQPHVRVERNLAQSENGHGMKQLELSLQVRKTVDDFLWQRPILRRCTTRRSADENTAQLETVVAVLGRGLIRETRTVEHPIQEFAGTVTGKHPAGAVRTVSRRGEADNHQLRVRIAEAGDGTSPVHPVAKGAPLHAGYLFPVVDQPGTLAAGDDFLV